MAASAQLAMQDLEGDIEKKGTQCLNEQKGAEHANLFNGGAARGVSASFGCTPPKPTTANAHDHHTSQRPPSPTLAQTATLCCGPMQMTSCC